MNKYGLSKMIKELSFTIEKQDKIIGVLQDQLNKAVSVNRRLMFVRKTMKDELKRLERDTPAKT